MKMEKTELFSAQSFHFFVTSVLRQIAAEEKKDIQFNAPLPTDMADAKDRRFQLFDAVAPAGLHEIDGPVVFAFKYSLKRNTISAVLSSLYKQIERASGYTELTVILITNSVHKEEDSDFYKVPEESKAQTTITTRLWGLDVLQNWISRYPIDFSNAVSHYESVQKVEYISDDITGSSFDNKSVNNSRAVKHIIESEDSFALVLGAGVSVEPGAKSWKQLLKYFEDELVKSGMINESDKLCEKIGNSSLITAQLCQELYRSDNDYFWAIHNGLYGKRNPLDPDFPICHIANIIKRCDHKQHFRILTYNYDDYLESYLDTLHISYNTLYDSECMIDNRLPIYHVHGFLPYVKYKTHMLQRHQKSIYLTEANFNELYNHPYSWQISSQLSFFRENTCLFIGCSLADPNIRRLLEMTKKENRNHFAILTKNKMTVKDLTLASNHFARLGIEVIWVEDYLDTRRQLRELY